MQAANTSNCVTIDVSKLKKQGQLLEFEEVIVKINNEIHKNLKQRLIQDPDAEFCVDLQYGNPFESLLPYFPKYVIVMTR